MIRIRKVVRILIGAVLHITRSARWQTVTVGNGSYDAIAYICPLGALETIFGSWAFVPRVLICLAVVVIVALVFGKAFCSWVCPVAPLSDLLRGRKAREKDECERTQAAHRVLERWSDTNAAQAEKHKPFRSRVDGRHVVLAGSLASAAVCGFPVFCLVCPIGLMFASAIALYRLIGFNEPAIEVLVFPALLVLELTVFRKWCHRFCPVGALLSLLSRGNRTFKPHVDASMCARHAGSSCAACAQACPEHIDPCADLGDRSLAECTRCGACVNTCPAKALSFVNRKE